MNKEEHNLDEMSDKEMKEYYESLKADDALMRYQYDNYGLE